MNQIFAALPLFDLAHALTLLATLAVAGCCVGLGVLAGARKLAVALVAGWGLGGLVLTVGGTLAGAALSPLLAGLGLAGMGGLALASARLPDMEWRASLRVLLLAAPFLLLAGAITPASFDDYSHWLPNLGELVLHDHLPSLAQPNLVSIRPGYPYGTAYIGLAVSRLTGELPEGAGVIWNALLLVGVGAMAADILGRRLVLAGRPDPLGGWALAAIGLLGATLASPSFVPRLFLSNYGDGPVGSVAGIMLAALMLEAVPGAAGQGAAGQGAQARRMAVLGLCGAALVAIRQDALSTFALVAGAAVLLALLAPRLGLALRLRTVALLLPAPLFGWALWTWYQTVQIPIGAATILPMAQWHWATMPETLLSMLVVALQKPGHFGLLLAETLAAAWFVLRPGRGEPVARAGSLLGAATGLGKVAVMAAIYLTADFDPLRASEAHEFWRFTVHVGPGVLLAGMTLLPLGWLAYPVGRRVALASAAAMLVLPVAGAAWLRPDVPRAGHVPYGWLRAVGREIAAVLPPGARLVLVDLDHDRLILPEVFPLRYRLALGEPTDHGTPAPVISIVAGTPPQPVRLAGGMPELPDAGLAPTAAAESLRLALAVPYVWVWDGGPAASALLGVALPAGQSALLSRGPAGLTVLRHWKLPR